MTTSWDDGHPSDIRLANLLIKYDLPGTFYVPLSNERPVLAESDIRWLSERFEIGGHTMTHCDLLKVDSRRAADEIRDCKQRLEEITFKRCRSFCFPMGRFMSNHIQLVSAAGYEIARTVELMSLDAPRAALDIGMMPTTLQAFPAKKGTYLKNSIKRGKGGNLLRYLLSKKESWVTILESLLNDADLNGGIVHLWGHSWEIEALNQWPQLESAFALLCSYRQRALYMSNAELWDYTRSRPAESKRDRSD